MPCRPRSPSLRHRSAGNRLSRSIAAARGAISAAANALTLSRSISMVSPSAKLSPGRWNIVESFLGEWPSGRLGFLKLQLVDHALAHDEFLHLAGDGQRHLVDEAHVARHLVVRNLLAAEVLDLCLARLLAWLQHDPRADLLAVLRVRHAEHLYRLHLGVAVEKFLDLAWIDVLSAADQHVLRASDDVAVAFGVDGGQVAGVHPAVLHHFARSRFIAPVALHHRIAAHAQLACLARRYNVAPLIDDLGFEPRLNLTNRRHATLEGIGGRALEGDRAGLRHAVGDGDLAHVHLAHHALHRLDRTGCAGHDAGPQAR